MLIRTQSNKQKEKGERGKPYTILSRWYQQRLGRENSKYTELKNGGGQEWKENLHSHSHMSRTMVSISWAASVWFSFFVWVVELLVTGTEDRVWTKTHTIPSRELDLLAARVSSEGAGLPFLSCCLNYVKREHVFCATLFVQPNLCFPLVCRVQSWEGRAPLCVLFISILSVCRWL